MKPLYKSFVPYLALLVVILITVFIFDNYAERISAQPQVVLLGGEQDENPADLLSWQMDREIAREAGAGTAGDSLFLSAMELFGQQRYREADEQAASLMNRAPRSPEVLNLRGLIALRLLEHHGAEAYFLKALEADPGFARARINLASLYREMHRYSEAEAQYLLAREADPNNAGIYYNLGMLYKGTGEPSASMDAFRRAAGLSSGNRKSKALCQLGLVQLERKDTLPARETLNEAILLDPRNELARLHLALTFSNARERENELTKIYNLNPGSFQANYYLGQLYAGSGEPARAEYHYKKALEKLPHNEQVMQELGDLLIAQQRMDEAALVLSGFTAGDTLPQAYFYQAKMAAEEGQAGQAIQLYRLAAEKSYHNYPEAYLNMAILYKERQEPAEAIAHYRNAIAARPNYSLAYYNLAVLYTELDSTGRAIESYLESIRIDPDAVKSWYNLGRLYDDQGLTERSIDAYRHALQVEPGYTRAMLALANAYLGIEDYRQAIDQYLELLTIYPNYSKAWFNLGLAYSRQDQPLKAMEAYEKLIEVDPEHVRARINLAILYGRNDRVRLAVSVLEDAMDLDMDNPDIRFNLALQYKKLGQPREAIHQFMQVIELDRGYRRAYEQLLLIHNELGDDVNYGIIAFRQQEQFEREADFYATGKRLLELEQPALALEAFDLARQAGDDRDWLLYWTGKAYLDLQRTGEAIGWFNRVLERDPGHKFSLYRLGQAYEMQGQSSEAEDYYAALLQLDAGFKIVHRSPLQSGMNQQ